MQHDFISATVLLLLVFDPFGSIPVFSSALRAVAPERRARVVLRECVIAFAVLTLFLLGGEGFMRLMQVSNASLSISGGIVLFLIALRMIFPSPEGVWGVLPQREPLIFPLAIPMLAGPSALATVLLLGARAPDRVGEWIAAVALALTISAAILAAAGRIQAALGERAVAAFERLMGLILAAIAVEMTITGLRLVKGTF